MTVEDLDLIKVSYEELYPHKPIFFLDEIQIVEHWEKFARRLADKLQAGEEFFIILDEILKGTNSMDKQKGSLALIKQFMTLQANGIIATHDLMLGTLADIYPDDIHNYRFEADITGNELTFSYRLREGVAQNMNACFLMKKMGIAVTD